MDRRLKGYCIAAGFLFFLIPVAVSAARLVSLTTCEQVSEPDFTSVHKQDQFAADTPKIHAIAILSQVKTGAKIKGVWVAVDAIQTPNYEIDSTEVQAQEDGEIKVHFSISGLEKGWPVGSYRLDLYLNDRLFAATPFSIIGEEGIRPVRPSAGFDLGPVRTDKNRAWTVVVYLDGDNNLEPFALADMDEMERSLPESGVDIIVLIDRAEGYSDGDGNWTDTRVYRIRRDNTEGIKSELLASPGELNLGDPSVLEAFLISAIKTFPAQRYALILWNHGGGWATHVTDEKAPGAPQEKGKLTLPELRLAVSGALKETGLKKLDLIGFDMCLMGQLETAYEIEGLADVMVGSEAVEPGDGWPYDTVIPLFGNPALSPRDIAKGIVKAFDDFYKGKQEPFTTQSAFDLSAVSDVVKALNDLLWRLDSALPEIWPSLTRSLFFSESYGDLADMRRANHALLSIDLGDAFQNLVDVVPALRSAPEYTALQASLNRLVLESKSSTRHRKSRGVALYAPFRQDLYSQEYGQTRFAQNSRWVSTLKQCRFAMRFSPGAMPFVVKGRRR